MLDQSGAPADLEVPSPRGGLGDFALRTAAPLLPWHKLQTGRPASLRSLSAFGGHLGGLPGRWRQGTSRIARIGET